MVQSSYGFFFFVGFQFWNGNLRGVYPRYATWDPPINRRGPLWSGTMKTHWFPLRPSIPIVSWKTRGWRFRARFSTYFKTGKRRWQRFAYPHETKAKNTCDANVAQNKKTSRVPSDNLVKFHRDFDLTDFPPNGGDCKGNGTPAISGKSRERWNITFGQIQWFPRIHNFWWDFREDSNQTADLVRPRRPIVFHPTWYTPEVVPASGNPWVRHGGNGRRSFTFLFGVGR